MNKGVQEIRFIFCQLSPSSQGLRQFLLHNLHNLRNTYPHTQFLVRESYLVDPTILIRYNFGIEKTKFLNYLSFPQINNQLQKLIDQSQQINSKLQ